MRPECNRCGKKFTVTSWTTDDFWRGVCPRCIIALLSKIVPDRSKIKES